MSDPHVHGAEPVNPDVHHEQTDVNVRALLWFTIVLVVFAILVHVGLYFHFVVLKRMADDPEHQPISLVEGEAPKLPPSPRLQPFPAPDAAGRAQSPLAGIPPADMDQMRRREDRELGTYGWLNRANGTIRIPIDRAMELQLQRGFPVMGAQPPEQQPLALPDRAQPAEPRNIQQPAEVPTP